MARSIDDALIARWRLRNLFLTPPHTPDVASAVHGLLGVQAENVVQTGWALAVRTPERRPDELPALLASGAVIRTHVLRPTWQYVGADDLGWLLDLTGPRSQRTTGQQLLTVHGLDERGLDAALAAAVEIVGELGGPVRPEIAERLTARGVTGGDNHGQFVMLLLAHAELSGLICGGAPRDDQHTYAVLDDRAPDTRRLDRDEALAELARRYLRHHGPATERDLAYWATMTLGDVRRGISAVAGELESFEHNGRTFWHRAGDAPPRATRRPVAHLLIIFDELYRGYQDSRWVLDAAGLVPRGRENSAGMALLDGQLVASVRRTTDPARVRFELSPYRALSAAETAAFEQEAQRYGAYADREAVLTVAG